MSELPAMDAPAQIVCPHCKKAFVGELLAGASPRQRGFKCPHCRLFVPAERVDDVVDPTGTS